MRVLDDDSCSAQQRLTASSSSHAGHEKTARLAEEASKCVSEVHFVPPQVHLLPPSQSAVAPASQAPYLPSPLGHEQDHSSQHQSYEQFSGGAGNGGHPLGPNGLHDDPTMLPMRFAGDNGPASPSIQSGYEQPQREIGIGAPPISPAAAYRKSYQLGHDQPSPLGANSGGDAAGSSSQAPRLDAYGNELPAGEGEGYDQAEALDSLGAPLTSPGLRNPSGRSAPPAHRLTLGLGSDIGSGGLMNDVPERTSSRGPGGPSSVPSVVPEASVAPGAAASHDSYARETLAHEDHGETSLPYVSEHSHEQQQQQYLSAGDEPAIPPPSSDGHSILQPPSAPFAQAQREMMSPASEKQSFVDAPDTLPRPGSQLGGPESQARDSVDLDYYSNRASLGALHHHLQLIEPLTLTNLLLATDYDEPPAPYQSPLPRPPQIIEPSTLAQQPPALQSQQSYSSARQVPSAGPVSVSTGPSPAEPNMPRGEAELASAAAKREVEREMDSLAYTASPIGHQPPVSPLEYAPREGESGARKINAGAFFKRNGAGGPAGSRSNSASFAPPVNDQGDGGVSEDDEANGTRPLRIGRNRPHDAFEVGSPPKDVAPPYSG